MLANKVVELSTDSSNPVLNFEVAKEYESQNQWAAAMSFYLRAAEYGWRNHHLIAYTSLLKIAHCAQMMEERDATALNSLLQAVSFDPRRPEAYFLLAQHYERIGDWTYCNTWSKLGYSLEQFSWEDLPADIGYTGSDSLLFELTVSDWWLGNNVGAKAKFMSLLTTDLPESYKKVIKHNLTLL